MSIRIARELSTNYQKQIRLEATYSNKNELADFKAGFIAVRDIFTREGVKPEYNQISENVTESQLQKQMQKQASNPFGIRVYGINFQQSSLK